MTDRKYTPLEATIKVLQKAEELAKAAMAGLKQTEIAAVPGVVSPSNGNTATPSKVGSQAVVKTAKPKKMGQPGDKPSIFFGKNEECKDNKKSSIENLRSFLDKQKAKHSL